MNVNNHPIEQEELMAYLDGELLPSQAAIAAAHLEQCRECQAVAADLQGVGRQLLAWQVESSGAGVEQRIAAELRQPVRQQVRHPRRVWPWVLSLAGAFAFVVLILSMGSPHMSMVRPVSRRVGAISLAQPGSAEITKPMIVHTAQLTLTTKEFDKARSGMEDILKRHGGYLGQLTASAYEGTGRVLEATLRVPDDQRDAVLTELRKLGRVESESQSGEEVTQQYVDLEARLSNARNAEQRLTDLLRQRTGKLSDVLAVEVEIDKVRGEIERMEAERKTLANRVTFATVNVKLMEDYKAPLQVVPDSTLARFRNAAVEGYRSMVEGVVGLLLFLLSYGPSLLLWAGLLFFPVRFLWRRRQRRLTSDRMAHSGN